MKLIRSDNRHYVFHFTRREKGLLRELLQRYPLVSGATERPHGAAAADPETESRRLLADALAAQRQETKRQVQAMLNEPGRFQETESGCHLTLSPPQMEWLLQVLNDIRVGSWITLGSPDTEKGESVALDAETAPHLWLMEFAGYFEMQLLGAMGEKLF